jgi:cysteine-rich repeat protein
VRTTILVAVVLAGCLPHDNLVSCPNDVLCPVGSVCDTVHGGCVSPDQTTVCIGVADHEACTAGAVFGYCLDEICIDPGCGNLVVDPGELCDDGNRDDGDGCSASCMSREVCGDGVLDLRFAEQCDDGNLISHDGCDSQCLTESLVWSYDPIGPAQANPTQIAFDASRGKIVLVRDGYVWAWDGVLWTVLATDAPNLASAYNIVFDPDTGKLYAIFARPQVGDILFPDPQHDILYEWDGTTWTQSMTTNAPAAHTLMVTYDTVRRRIFALGVTVSDVPVSAVLDPVTKVWSTVPPPAAVAGMASATIVFDQGRGRVVVGIPAEPTVHGQAVLEWNGSTWSMSTPAMTVTSGWSLMYDQLAQRVIAIGGTAGATTTAAQAWNGVAWTNLLALPGNRQGPTVAFDTLRQKRFVFGGDSYTTPALDPDEIVEGDQLAWNRAARTTPPPSITVCAYEEPRARLVCVSDLRFDATGETWVWSGTWSKLAAVLPDDPPSALAYDPIRKAIVGLGVPGLIQLSGDTWVPLAQGLPLGDPASSLVFDPRRKRLVGVTQPLFGGIPHLILIQPDNSVVSVTSAYFTGFAYDARNGVVVASGSGSTVELDDQTWVPCVGPGASYRAVTNDRRGTVEFIAPGLATVERIGSTFETLGSPPPMAILGSLSIVQTTGELMAYGRDGYSRFLLHRRWTSATPFETCEAGVDGDGDGLAACDDPDCWPRCAAACPPLASCP